MSRSDAIRQYLRSNPNSSANDCVKALRKQGTIVTPALFYSVKSKVKQPVTENRPFVPVVNNTVETVIKVKALAKELGGLRQLANLCEAMS